LAPRVKPAKERFNDPLVKAVSRLFTAPEEGVTPAAESIVFNSAKVLLYACCVIISSEDK
jgi:hypothetical protein